MGIGLHERIARDAATDARDLAKDAYRHFARSYAALASAIEAGHPPGVINLLTEDHSLALVAWRASLNRCKQHGIPTSRNAPGVLRIERVRRFEGTETR